jgi:hypothetical protein
MNLLYYKPTFNIGIIYYKLYSKAIQFHLQFQFYLQPFSSFSHFLRSVFFYLWSCSTFSHSTFGHSTFSLFLLSVILRSVNLLSVILLSVILCSVTVSEFYPAENEDKLSVSKIIWSHPKKGMTAHCWRTRLMSQSIGRQQTSAPREGRHLGRDINVAEAIPSGATELINTIKKALGPQGQKNLKHLNWPLCAV